MLSSPRSYLKSYGLAVLSVGIATTLMLAISPWSAMSQAPFLLYWGAVALSAWYGGIGPGLVATALAALISTYFFLPPLHQWTLDIDSSIELTLFVVQGGLISALCEALLRAKRRAEKNLRSLQLNEEAFQQKEEKYRILTENVPQLLWITKADGFVEYFNQRWYDYTGLTPGKSLGWEWQQAIHPEDLLLTLEKWIDGLERGNEVENQYRLRRADGAYRWYITRAVPLRDAQGVVTNWFGTCTDIHEQKQAEQEQIRLRTDLEAERKLLNTVIQQVPAAVLIAEAPSGRLLLNNPQVEQIIQGSVPILKKIDDYRQYPCFYPNGQPYAPQETPLARAILSGEIVIDEEMDLFCGNGVMKTILASTSPIRDPQGQIIAAIATFYDITKRKRSEAALRESEERFRLTTTAAELGMWFWDLVGGELVWTEKCKSLFGLAPEAKVNYEVFLNSLHPDDRSYTHEAVNRALKDRVEYDIEYRTIWPDGSLYWIAAKGRGFYDETTGQAVRMMGTAQDITARKRTEQRLAAQYAITSIIAEATKTDVAVFSILRSLCETLDWPVGIIWSVDRQTNRLQYVDSWYLPTRTDVGSSIEQFREKTFIPGEGLPGLIWESNCPAWVCDLSEGEFPRLVLTDEALLQGAFGFPIRIENQVLGVIECFSDNIQAPDPDLLQMMDVIGTQIGQFIERKQAEEALQENQHLLQRVIDTIPGLLYIYDLVDDRNVYVNRQIAELLGYSPEQIGEMGSNLFPQLLHPEDLAKVPELIARFDTAQDGKILESEYRMCHVNGEWRWFASRETVFSRTADDSPKQVLGTAYDITEQKQAQEALRHEKERFELAASALNCVIYDWDLTTNYVERTEGLIHVVGFLPAEAEPTKNWWVSRIHPDDFPQAQDKILADLSKSNCYTVEYRVLNKDERYVYVLDRGIVTRDANGKPIRIVGSTVNITERKLAEAALQESQELFECFMNHSPLTAFIKDEAGRYIYINTLGESLINRQPADWLGKTDFDFFVRETARQVRDNDLAVLTTGQTIQVLEKISLEDGEHTYLSYKFPLQDRSGRKLIAGMSIDITEQTRTQEALRESMAILSAINEGTPTLIFVKDRQGHIVMANSSTIRAIGKPEEQIIGRTDIEYQSNRELALQIMENDRLIMETGEMKVFEETAELPGGTRTFLSVKSPYRDEKGNIIGLIGIAVDVTERMQAEKALHQSEERFRQYADNINDVLWMSEPQAERVLYVSPAYEKIWGRSREGLYANFAEWFEGIHPDDREQVRTAFFSEILAGKYDKEYRVVRPDGSICWVRDRGFLIKTEPEMPYRVAGIAEDITERKQAEAALQERTQELIEVNKVLTNMTALLQKRNQELDQFAYIVSHDLKAPLRAIANLSQWIQDDLEEQLPEENQKQMQLLRDRVFRMENLINGLLEFSRVGRIQTAIKTVDVAELLSEVIDSLAPPATFMITIDSGMPTLTTPELALQQVFANLLGNAIKHHGRSNGHVQISVTSQKDYYQFAVTDDGQGIAPEHHERIFGIFQTSKSGDNKENTGIGLAIVKKIVETQGGTIVVKSELDRGTTFCFTWPKQPK